MPTNLPTWGQQGKHLLRIGLGVIVLCVLAGAGAGFLVMIYRFVSNLAGCPK